MKPDDLEPLSTEALAQLSVERERPAMGPARRQHLLDRLETTIAGVGSGGSGSGDGGSGSGGDGGRGGSGSSPAPAGGRIGSALLPRLPFSVTTFLLGGAVGAGVYGAVAPRPADPPAAVSSVARTVPATPVATALPVVPAPLASAQPAPVPSAMVTTPALDRSRETSRGAARPDDEGSGRDVALSAERALLETARAAVARGQSGPTIAALRRHEQEFPHGRLAEERESMWVQALVMGGQYDEARARAARFRQQFPDSMLLPAVESAIGSIP